MKARYITANSKDPRLLNVSPRLGGFHLLMSFLGAIGYIMEDSGLKELFNTVYAMNSIDKMMTGHAYYRALRAHLLAHAVLMKFVLEIGGLSPEIEAELDNILCPIDKSVILASNPYECVAIKEKVCQTFHQLKERGATAQLWVQYIEMVFLLKTFILAERMGNWDLHLETIWRMLPYFHASGHFAYAKCAHLYLQDMLQLSKTMPQEEFDKFTSEGFFTIRRTSKFWSGTWTDMLIEQFLMKNMKLQGGLTHGRGVGEGVLTRWTMGVTSVLHVSEQIETFCGVSLNSSVQHVEFKDSRIKRDNKDSEKMFEWLQQHLPFPHNPSLYSLSTGVVADDRVTCHKAKELGVKALNNIVGADFGSVKFKRNDRVKPLAVMNNAIQVDNQTVTVNPTTLFQRISVAKHSNEDLEDFLSYDLGPYSLSLFDKGCMRKGTKSSLYKSLKPLNNKELPDKVQYVIDGGFLLHRVVWPTNALFSSICDKYIQYLNSKYPKAVVVFDGYPEDAQSGTKTAERLRRSRTHSSADMLFDETMTPPTTKDSFLANPKNKSRLIALLATKFTSAGLEYKQAEEDADTLIVSTALNLAESNEAVVVVGEDIDLLVILVGLCQVNNVYFLKPGKENIRPALYSPIEAATSPVKEHILFLHAMSGCDTTSALFNQGKTKLLKTLEKNPSLGTIIAIFKDSTASQESVATAGERFLVQLYGFIGKTAPTLNHQRYICFTKAAFRLIEL